MKSNFSENPESRISFAVSIIVVADLIAPPARSESVKYENFFDSAFCKLSRLGVADPKRQLIFKNLARYIAQSLALYLGLGSNCL